MINKKILKEVLFNYLKKDFTESKGKEADILRNELIENIQESINPGEYDLDINEIEPYLEEAFKLGIEFGGEE